MERQLKEYYLTFNPELIESGIDAIALTSQPAVELFALRFNTQQEFSFNDYPEAVKNAAKRGIKLNEEQGNKCATQVGKVRAQQLANGEAVSLETVQRMYSYLSRAAEYYNPDDTEACGTISYLLWGGEPALNWSKRILDENTEELSEIQQFGFSFDSDKQIIAGPAIIPNKKIYRKDPDGKEYYVIFTQEVIDAMVDKFNSELRGVVFNIEHDSDKPVEGFIKGCWIVEDPEKDKSAYYGFKNLPKGTFFIEARITDPAQWAAVKQMENVGFSVEGLMGLIPTPKQDNKLETFNKQTKMANKRKFVANKLSSRKAFSMTTKKFEQVLVSTEEEILIVDALEVGAEVEVLNDNAEVVAAENGTYIIESEEVQVTVAEGVIETVEELSAEQVAEVVEPVEEVVEDTPAAIVDNTMVEELIAKMAAFETRLEALENQTKEQEESEMTFSKQTKGDRLTALKSLI